MAGPECAQDEFPLLEHPRVTTEDCLYLNVFTPAGKGKRRPVMVYFHGGAFITGSANPHDGSALAARGVVVVTVNYRLGAFGFLAHPSLSAEDAQVKSGNYGTLDQQEALRWVQRNAEAFGGDARNVTIFGTSAGGFSVCAHLASPRAAGLFTRAIIESGPCDVLATPLQDAEANGAKLATTAGCGDRPDVTACLRAAPGGTILDAVRNTPELAGPSQVFEPTVSTPVLPVAPSAAIASGNYNKVPVMAGTTLDEGTLFTLIMTEGMPLDAKTYPVLLENVFGSAAPFLQQMYPVEGFGGNFYLALSAILTDASMACQTVALGGSLAATTPTFTYEFADRTVPSIYAGDSGFPFGAYHGAEVLYLFSIPGVRLNAAQRQLAAQIQSYWAAFAAAGDPNRKGTPLWERFDPARPKVLSLDLGQISNRDDFQARHKCEFWNAAPASQ